MADAGDEDLTRKLTDLLTAWPADAQDVLARARLLLLDGLGVAVAGAGEPGPRMAAELARADQAAPVATVIGHGFATSLTGAARVNGMAMHVLDFEPMWHPANHALSSLLPALLGLAEQREAGGAPAQGRELLIALAKGVEIQGRLRLSSGQMESHELTLHPPGAVGSLAAAAAVGTFLGFDAQRMAMAVGTAASRLGGIMANVGTMTKALHCGDAAAHGLEAALLAEKGFTADVDALGGPRGWGRSLFGPRFDPAPILAPLEVPRILTPGPAWKLFPSQYGTHFAITAALEARGAIADPRDIEAVTLHLPSMPYLDRPAPASGLAGKFSWQYVASVALLDGRVDPASFADQRRFAPDMEAMLRRVKLEYDASIPARFDLMHVSIAVRLKDGTLIERRCDAPLGNWRRPAPAEAVKQKARGLLNEALGPEKAGRLLELISAPADRLSIRPVMANLNVRLTP